jgi:hypothetical protein
MSDKNLGKRQAAEEFILKYIEQLVPGSANAQNYKDLMGEMDDKQFHDFISSLGSGETSLAIVAPNFSKSRITIENNLRIADELGHEFYERLWIKDSEDTPAYLSPVAYLVFDLPLRRQAQLQVKKMSVPEDNMSVDDLTGQPSGKSDSAKISFPETQVLAALKLDYTLKEFLKYRGGDTQGFNAMNDSFAKTGGASQEAIKHLAGGVRSTQTLRTLLTAMHYSVAGLGEAA